MKSPVKSTGSDLSPKTEAAHAAMLLRAFAGFHGLFIAWNPGTMAGNLFIKQQQSCIRGGAHDEHPVMLLRAFAI